MSKEEQNFKLKLLVQKYKARLETMRKELEVVPVLKEENQGLQEQLERAQEAVSEQRADVAKKQR
jgi:multidrug resistance efflux pump